MVLENEADYKSRSQAIALISEKFGCSRATLRDWVNRQGVENGERDGLTQSERDELKELQRENRELRQANEILRKGELVKTPLVQAHWRTLFSQRRSPDTGAARGGGGGRDGLVSRCSWRRDPPFVQRIVVQDVQKIKRTKHRRERESTEFYPIIS